MAKRGRFSGGAGYGGVPMQIINQIRSQAAGGSVSDSQESAASVPSPSSSGRVGTWQLRKDLQSLKPDYSGLDFTGLDRKAINKLKKTRWTPEYIAARKALNARKKEFMTPYTQEQIQNDPALRAIASGITLEQAIASYRQLVKVMNATPMAGQVLTTAQKAKLYKLRSSLTDQQKNSQRIIGMLGGYGAEPSGRNPWTGETWLQGIYRRLGMSDKVPTGTRQSPETYRIDPNFGPIISIPNQLNATQRARFQRLKAMNPKQMTAKQKEAYQRLFNLKNAPKIVESEE